METWPQLKVSSDRLVKPGIEPATSGLQDKPFIHYTLVALAVFKFLEGIQINETLPFKVVDH